MGRAVVTETSVTEDSTHVVLDGKDPEEVAVAVGETTETGEALHLAETSEVTFNLQLVVSLLYCFQFLGGRDYDSRDYGRDRDYGRRDSGYNRSRNDDRNSGGRWSGGGRSGSGWSSGGGGGGGWNQQNFSSGGYGNWGGSQGGGGGNPWKYGNSGQNYGGSGGGYGSNQGGWNYYGQYSQNQNWVSFVLFS